MCFETVLYSSRYFVLKIEDGAGKHAIIGLGFVERNKAFDCNVALSDHEKYVKREHEKEETDGDNDGGGSIIDVHPALNHQLKEGETIRINVKPKPMSGAGMLSVVGLSGTAVKPKPSGLGLDPPPGSGKVRSALPPPPNDPVAARISSGGVKSPNNPRRGSGPLSDLSQIERNLPSETGSGLTKTTAAGWAAF